jgi:SAM-dependent methyltransferase
MRQALKRAYQQTVFPRKIINTFLPSLEPIRLLSRDRARIVRADPIWEDGHTYSTELYKEITGAASEGFIAKVKEVVPKDARVLDVCCNQGRFLTHLWNLGWRHLSGFDIMRPAIAHLISWNDQNGASIDATIADAGDYLRSCADGSFDYIISHGATLELVHPLNNVCQHLRRIARKGAVLLLNEHTHSYPRFWHLEFRRAGFKIVSAEQICGQTLFVLK